jgi:hypothetical protein
VGELGGAAHLVMPSFDPSEDSGRVNAVSERRLVQGWTLATSVPMSWFVVASTTISKVPLPLMPA